MIENQVKLIIWDLDETFWQGTLAEGGHLAIPANVEMVRELSRRGIVNSICSKNDHERAKAILVELDIWDHFVFPSITFNPKGKAIAELIETAALRPENVLFIDDNVSNLEEAKFFNPGLMTAHPADILDKLLDHPHCIGKPDPELTRLQRYRLLERKASERSATSLSNEEFLRSSEIRVEIDYEVEKDFDRIVELINRTNQLNYTKKRLNTPEELDKFRGMLNSYGYHTGSVRVADKYGEYGLVGFFAMKRKSASSKELIHFVFSCRTMNMGLEQHVYELLGEPEIEIVQPVSYGLKSHAEIDWILPGGQAHSIGGAERGQNLVLVGGCDMLQLASYCGTNRVEFVNGFRGDPRIFYTDPYFILTDRSEIEKSRSIRNIPSWTHQDAALFDEAVAASDLILLSLWPGMQDPVFETRKGLRMRIVPSLVRELRSENQKWFERHFEECSISEEERFSLIRDAFDEVARKSAPNCVIFVLGVYTKGVAKERRKGLKSRFNELCRQYCAAHPARFRYLDLDAIIPVDSLVSNSHFSRHGYFALARHIMGLLANDAPRDEQDKARKMVELSAA